MGEMRQRDSMIRSRTVGLRKNRAIDAARLAPPMIVSAQPALSFLLIELTVLWALV